MEEYKQKRIMSIIGLIIAFISYFPATRGFDNLHANPSGTGIWLAVFITGMILGYSVFMKTPTVAAPQQSANKTQKVQTKLSNKTAMQAQSKKFKWWYVLIIIAALMILGFLLSVFAYIGAVRTAVG